MKRVGIIGYGNMGQAIAERIKTKYQVYVFEKEQSKTQNLSGISVTSNIEDLLRKVVNIILAVKPQDFEIVLNKIKSLIKGKLIISIAAGISTSYIEKQLGRVRVIRVMPNLAVKVGKGMICLSKGRYSFVGELGFVRRIFSYLGKTMLVKEDLMDAVTAVSGSGPGYFYDLIKNETPDEWEDYGKNIFIPQLSSIAKEIGFTKQQAEILAKTTLQGSIALLKQTGLSPEILCAQVCSKGGTTEAGLAVLRCTNSLEEAVKAALQRARDLAKQRALPLSPTQ
jgi:pyrroline-5-carboxylate reductase